MSSALAWLPFSGLSANYCSLLGFHSTSCPSGTAGRGESHDGVGNEFWGKVKVLMSFEPIVVSFNYLPCSLLWTAVCSKNSSCHL